MDDRDEARAALFLDDLTLGQRFSTGELRVDAERMVAFAAEFDPQPFHLDEAAAQGSLFGGLAASGWHTAALTMRLMVTSGPAIAGGLIGAAVELSWPRPTRPGDVLHVESEVTDIAPSRSRPERGMVTMRSETRNQDGAVVQVMVGRMVVPRRAEQGAATGAEVAR